ncbi:MAG: two pore domain potassium channel family protein, partial [Chitinophagia bacterium]|nr:two pore domain potassium channel family protein [Chitinophagia bacterium]
LLLGTSFDNTPVVPGALKRQRANLKKVWNNEMHNDIGVERLFRIILLLSLYIFPGLYIRELAGRKGNDAKNLAVEFYVILKLFLPITLLISGGYQHWLALAVTYYMLAETLSYLTSLIFLADIHPRLRSIRRSLFLLFLNYIEIVCEFAVIYASLNLLEGKATTLFDHVYFSLITSATVGYGDIAPTTQFGKLMCCCQAMIFLVFVILFLNVFGSKVDAVGYKDNGAQ